MRLGDVEMISPRSVTGVAVRIEIKVLCRKQTGMILCYCFDDVECCGETGLLYDFVSVNHKERYKTRNLRTQSLNL
jgi:hypothetical protein